MEESLQNKTELKDRLIRFYDSNKTKIYTVVIVLIISLILFIFFKQSKENQNTFIAEKYVTADVYLNSNRKDKALEIFEEIILSKNKFYSILALNTIVEKELISDKDKILKYFDILEKSISEETQEDLIILKKALYLIKQSENQRGIDLLKKLVEKKSSLSDLAQDILNK